VVKWLGIINETPCLYFNIVGILNTVYVVCVCGMLNQRLYRFG